ncbi:hypothetical protein Ddc_09315 [Ditylenchus destructor]|nr:hypothetical protein Ddc_09315 [Ditylenchus destructor]
MAQGIIEGGQSGGSSDVSNDPIPLAPPKEELAMRQVPSGPASIGCSNISLCRLDGWVWEIDGSACSNSVPPVYIMDRGESCAGNVHFSSALISKHFPEEFHNHKSLRFKSFEVTIEIEEASFEVGNRNVALKAL